jgi:hypothetical protein
MAIPGCFASRSNTNRASADQDQRVSPRGEARDKVNVIGAINNFTPHLAARRPQIDERCSLVQCLSESGPNQYSFKISFSEGIGQTGRLNIAKTCTGTAHVACPVREHHAFRD